MAVPLSNSNSLIGSIFAISSYTIWGFLPIYWKTIAQVSSWEIFAHRIIWSFFFCSMLIFIRRQQANLKEILGKRKSVLYIIIGSLLINTNWSLYIWAVNSNHILDTSLGYYINPLLCVAFGVIILKERLNFWQLISVSLAFIGVAVVTVQYGEFPWISLGLAASFGLYGLVKKKANLDDLAAFTLEIALTTLPALIYLIYLKTNNTLGLGSISLQVNIMLVGAGIVTALPVLLFSRAAKLIDLSRMGFLQYFSPTIALLLGVFVYREQFTSYHAVSFGFIWSALALYILSGTKFFQGFRQRQ